MPCASWYSTSSAPHRLVSDEGIHRAFVSTFTTTQIASYCNDLVILSETAAAETRKMQ